MIMTMIIIINKRMPPPIAAYRSVGLVVLVVAVFGAALVLVFGATLVFGAALVFGAVLVFGAALVFVFGAALDPAATTGCTLTFVVLFVSLLVVLFVTS